MDNIKGSHLEDEMIISQYVTSVKLTRREQQMLQFLVEGKFNKEIASMMNVKEKTVEFHITNLLQKLQVSSRTEAAAWVLQGGVTPKPRDFPSSQT